MPTIKDVKDKLINHLLSIDLPSLNMMDLSTYTGIVCQVNGMDKEDYMTTLAKMVSDKYNLVEKTEAKEESTNG